MTTGRATTGDRWISREPGDFALTPSVRLIATPGHTAEDITTLAAAPDDVYACTHAWWGPDGPADDPLGTDQAALHQSRARILEVATVIVPGHGPAFRPPGTCRTNAGRGRRPTGESSRQSL